MRDLNPQSATLLSAAVGAIVALTVSFLTRRSAERRWMREAKWETYSGVIKNAVCVLDGLTAATIPKLKRSESRDKAVEALSDLGRACLYAPSLGALLPLRFFKATLAFHRYARVHVLPLINRAALESAECGETPMPEMPNALHRASILVGAMEIAAYTDLGWLPRRYWWSYRYVTKPLVFSRAGDTVLRIARRITSLDDDWRFMGG